MYECAAECEIPEDVFWNSSPTEITEMIRRYQKKERRLFKEKVRSIFLLAEVVTRYMTRDEKADAPHPWEYYPDLFKEDQKIYEEEKEREELEEYKEARRAYVAEFNRRRQQE